MSATKTSGVSCCPCHSTTTVRPLSVTDVSSGWWRAHHMTAIVRCGRLQRLGQAPRVIQRAVCPRERVKRAARRRGWRAFQRDVAEESFALGPALFAESLRRFMDGEGDRRVQGRIRIRRGIEPGCECVGAGLEAGGSLPTDDHRWDPSQVAFERRQMIQGVAEPDETKLHRAWIDRVERDRLQEMVDLLDRLRLRGVCDRLAGETPPERIN